MFCKGHINYFNINNLSMLLKELGFDVILKKNYFKILDMYYLLDLSKNRYPRMYNLIIYFFKKINIPNFRVRYLAGEKIIFAKKRDI